MRKELEKKVERAIKLIQSASEIAKNNGCPELEVAYSGGKDSDVILELTKMANVPYRAIYKNTTIDPSGTIKHAKDVGAELIRPKKSFFQLVQENGLPNRFSRFCCRLLKEYKVLDYAIVGIRREESAKRASRYKEPEQCRVYSKKEKVRQYMPILDWSAIDVEEFIKERDIKCAPIYYDQEGKFHVEQRLGCMCCVLASRGKRINQFKEKPNMVKAYVHALKKYFDTHKGNKQYKSYNGDVYAWFVRDLFYNDNTQGWLELNNGFIPPPNYKDFLEDYFKIKFKD